MPSTTTEPRSSSGESGGDGDDEAVESRHLLMQNLVIPSLSSVSTVTTDKKDDIETDNNYLFSSIKIVLQRSSA